MCLSTMAYVYVELYSTCYYFKYGSIIPPVSIYRALLQSIIAASLNFHTIKGVVVKLSDSTALACIQAMWEQFLFHSCGPGTTAKYYHVKYDKCYNSHTILHRSTSTVSRVLSKSRMYCCLMADCLAISSHSVWRCSSEVKPCKDCGELTRSKSVSITARKENGKVDGGGGQEGEEEEEEEEEEKRG